MTERRFSKKCGECKKRAMQLQDVNYSVQVDHDGRKYPVQMTLRTPKCANCGAISIDPVAEEAIELEFRKVANLLTPQEVREGRGSLGLTQQQMADELAIAAATLSRWETGTQRQQRFHDKVLRAYFGCPTVREVLKAASGSCTVEAFEEPSTFFIEMPLSWTVRPVPTDRSLFPVEIEIDDVMAVGN